MAASSARTKVLTVGDGDLSLSLALSRAYGDHIDLTASVLEADSSEFQRVFPEAPLDELNSRGVAVLCGVDATQLHSRYILPSRIKRKPWDLVSFHHPHLGISNLEKYDEATRAVFHHRLLCHYLHSAKQISNSVHVCLTGTQPETWKLFDAAKLQNLRLVQTISDTKPFAHVLMDQEKDMDLQQDLPEPSKIEAHFAAPRKYRNGKLGKHFLAKYGYRHRRTEGVLFQGSTKDADVSESMHFVFASDDNDNSSSTDPQNKDTVDSDTHTNKTSFVCPICRESFDSESGLQAHLACPINVSAITGASKPRIDPNSISENSPTRIVQIPNSNIPPASEVPREMEVEQSYDENLGIVLRVPSTNNGKRLRWFLQHAKIDNLKFSKRLAENTIQAGLVSVNGEVAVDSSRILQDGDTVTIRQTKGGDTIEGNNSRETTVSEITKVASKKAPTIEIVQRAHSRCPLQWLVVVKPSGMRTKGNFPGTLEYTVSEQLGAQHWSLSSLETSCPGLCVMIPAHESLPKPSDSCFKDGTLYMSVSHTMTALVHGPLTREMIPFGCPAELELEAKWRNKKRKHALEEPSSESQQVGPNDAIKKVPAMVDLKEYFVESQKKESDSEIQTTALSTVEIATDFPSSSAICRWFREIKKPVVGDSFCKQEYSKLQRSIRNRIKNKLCIGCFRVSIFLIGAPNLPKDAPIIELPIPDKLSAKYWERFLSKGSTNNEVVQR